MNKNKNQEAIEKLAKIEHERWSHWQQYLHSQCIKNDNGSLTIPHELVLKWEKQLSTIYEELSDKEKESDRELVLRDFDNLLNIFKKIIT